MNTHKNCPICDHNHFDVWMEVADYFLTNENFSLVKCRQCGFILTNPYPTKAEIERYYHSDEYYSHPNKRKGLISKVYEMVKLRNVKYKFRVATSGLERGRILDIGCGSGDFLAYAKTKGWEIHGIEPNSQAKSFSEKRLEIKLSDPDQITAISDFTFDVITLWHVLEHVEDLSGQLIQLKRILKPGGRLVIALPNPDAHDAKYYGKYWAAFDVPRHLYHFRFQHIRQLLNLHQFGFLKREPLKWDAFYISLLSERYKTGKQQLPKAIFRGLVSNVNARKSREFSSNIYLFFSGK